ncbi:hypothetical protein FA15DRAFT_605543, partial [Coprinopsis marcescibilis]
FKNYSTPVPNQLYSNEFFNHITFSLAAKMPYPTIAPDRSLTMWTFDPDTPTNMAAMEVDEGKAIPSSRDLHPIVSQMERAYNEGSRSVVITLTTGGRTKNLVYHFMKIRLCVNVNNNHGPITQAKDIFTRLSSLLSPLLRLKLGQSCICSQIQGFMVGTFPLYKLGTLLGEEWIEEDVLNALCELCYFRTHPNVINGSGKSMARSLVVPTLLASNVCYLLEAPSAHDFKKRSALSTANIRLLQRYV